MTSPGALARSVARRLADGGAVEEGSPLVVALSGGRDSVALLHMLRFTEELAGLDPVAAHFDHAMRPGSGGDARWVVGLCAAWGVRLRTARAAVPPSGEADARRARYDFLLSVRAEEGARWLLTAHHADDQAETVLFRALRGTGPRGLAGIRERREPGVWRPLLPFTADEIDRYARAVGLSWREDPTNRLPLARNVLRHEVLPRIEERVAPGARGALAGLARRMARDEAGWASLLPGLLDPLDVREVEGGCTFLRDALLAYHPGVRARLLRSFAERLGRPLGERGTRSALGFIHAGASGSTVELGGRLLLGRDFDRLTLRTPAAAAGRPGVLASLGIPGTTGGSGRVCVEGRWYLVSWGAEPLDGPSVELSIDALRLPLVVRGWRFGDRIRLPRGTKKLKKVFLERRIPVRERRSLPVLVDGSGAVLWVPGVARSSSARPVAGGRLLHVRIADDDVHAD